MHLTHFFMMYKFHRNTIDPTVLNRIFMIKKLLLAPDLNLDFFQEVLELSDDNLDELDRESFLDCVTVSLTTALLYFIASYCTNSWYVVHTILCTIKLLLVHQFCKRECNNTRNVIFKVCP